ncbi:MAG: hypothetical protein WBO28_10065 [Flavobacteriales bacterium]
MNSTFSWARTAGLAFACALAFSSSAQQSRQAVLVLDSLDGTPVAYAEVAVGDNVVGSTDAEGRCVVPWNRFSAITVSFSQVGYGKQLRTLSVHTELKNGIWEVRLMPAEYHLGPIAVGRAAPVEVFRRKDLHAADLLINNEGLWVLAYEHPRMLRVQGDAGKEILREVRLVLLDTAYNELASCPVPEDVFGLRHDLRNDVVIEGTRHAFGVGRRGDELVLQPFGLEELRRAVLPWTDSIPGWVVGSNADSTYPALDHLALDPLRDSTRKICSVVDTFMMDLFRSSYKYMRGSDKVLAMNLAADLGTVKETVAGYMTGFSHNIWYRPVYAPLFVVGDTLLVFDHACKQLRKFMRDFSPAGEVSLPYQEKSQGRDWAEKLIQDRVSQQIYAVFQRNGMVWLRSVDPVTGSLGASFRLSFPYPDKVQVHAGQIYYIWRPSGSLQKRTIYREPVPVP